jgi:hypothetical protein
MRVRSIKCWSEFVNEIFHRKRRIRARLCRYGDLSGEIERGPFANSLTLFNMNTLVLNMPFTSLRQ